MLFSEYPLSLLSTDDNLTTDPILKTHRLREAG